MGWWAGGQEGRWAGVCRCAAVGKLQLFYHVAGRRCTFGESFDRRVGSEHALFTAIAIPAASFSSSSASPGISSISALAGIRGGNAAEGRDDGVRGGVVAFVEESLVQEQRGWRRFHGTRHASRHASASSSGAVTA